MTDKYMPDRIFAYRYHAENQKGRARGAWDDRQDHRCADDVDYVRADSRRALVEAIERIDSIEQAAETRIAQRGISKEGS